MWKAYLNTKTNNFWCALCDVVRRAADGAAACAIRDVGCNTHALEG